MSRITVPVSWRDLNYEHPLTSGPRFLIPLGQNPHAIKKLEVARTVATVATAVVDAILRSSKATKYPHPNDPISAADPVWCGFLAKLKGRLEKYLIKI